MCPRRTANLVIAGAMLLSTWLGALASAASLPPRIIVVGTGLAGLSAALESAQQGAEVTIIDMWSVFGGTSIMSGGKIAIVDTPLQQSKGIADSPELALSDFERRSKDFDKKWVDYYARNSRAEIFDWLSEAGVNFRKVVRFGGNSVPRAHGTGEEGVGLMVPLFQACVKHPRITFVWNTKVTELITEEERVVGARGENIRLSQTHTFRGGAVILATGGFQSNLNLIREHWPKSLPVPERILTGSGANSQGIGHAMAEALGADFHRMDYVWNYPYGLPDPRYPGSDRGLLFAHGQSVWVNGEGNRFVNESGSIEEKMTAILSQNPTSYWAIFDHRQKERVYVAGSFFAKFPVVDRLIYGDNTLVKKADSIGALAEILGIPGATLEATVENFNAMIERGNDSAFGRFEEGRKLPQKIKEPPFYAVQLFPLTRKNMGGVQTDHSCRVVDRDGKIIPGLYAAGELSGFAAINGTSPLEGTFLGPCVVTGRVAGRTACRESSQRPSETAKRLEAIKRSSPSKENSKSSCIDCHDLKVLTQLNRPGFTHFEYAHRQVLKMNYNCVMCHSNLIPYSTTTHHIDWGILSHSCRICHLPEK